MESIEKVNFDLSYVFEYYIAKKGGINQGCKYIAKRLNYEWVWKHIYNVYRGAKPSERLVKRLQSLMKPHRKRDRMIIEADTTKQLREWQTLTTEQKKHALDREVILRRIR